VRIWLLALTLAGCTRPDDPPDAADDTDVVADTDAPADLRLHDEASLAAAEGITAVAGSVWIDASGLDHVDALSSLRSIGGDLVITGGRRLVSLGGLSSLRSVGGDLRVDDATSLVDLTGLGALEQIGGAWEMHGLVSLASVAELSALHEVGGPIALAALPSLTSLACAPGLSTVHGLHIEGLTALPALDGPGVVTTAAGDVLVRDSAVASLPWASALPRVGGTLQLARLPSLVDVSGLASVQAVDGDLVLDDLSALESLSGLDALAQVDGWLTITDTPLLADLIGLSALTTVQGVVLEALPKVVTLDSWTQLTRVPDTLRFSHMTALSTLSMPALVEVGDLIVDRAPELASLSGLGSITSLHGLGLYGNSGLRRLGWADAHVAIDGWITLDGTGLRTLDDVTFEGELADVGPEVSGASLAITRNALLTDLSGLSGVTGAAGAVWLRGLGQVVSLHGLEALSHTGALEISGSPLLADLSGLVGLRTVVGDLTLADNPLLVDVSGLYGLSAADQMILARVPGLCEGQVEALAAALPHIPMDTGALTCPSP
jgi:hypothetical protein